MTIKCSVSGAGVALAPDIIRPIGQILLVAGIVLLGAQTSSGQFADGELHRLPSCFVNPRHVVLSEHERGFVVFKSVPDSTDDTHDHHSLYFTTTRDSSTVILPRAAQTHRKFLGSHFRSDTGYIATTNHLFTLVRSSSTWQTVRTHRFHAGVTGVFFHRDSAFVWDDLARSRSSPEFAMSSQSLCLSNDVTTRLDPIGCVRGWPLAYLQPRQVISFSERCRSICDLSAYRTLISDRGGRCDTLTRPDVPGFSTDTTIDTIDMRFNPQAHFPSIQRFAKQNSTITRSVLLNDTTLGVIWCTAQLDGRGGSTIPFVDLWKKHDSGWSLATHDVPLSARLPNEEFTILQLRAWRDAHLSQAGIAYLVVFPDEWDVRRHWSSYEEFVTERDAYFESRQIQLMLVMHRWQ